MSEQEEKAMTDRVRIELLQIMQQSTDGLLNPHDVLEWARLHPGSALYQRIEWDDVVAADNWRLEQIRQLIKYHVRSETGEPQVISLQIDRSNGGGYRDIGEVRSMTDILEREAIRELRRLRMRYGHLKNRALQKIWKEVDGLQLKPATAERAASRSSSPPAA